MIWWYDMTSYDMIWFFTRIVFCCRHPSCPSFVSAVVVLLLLRPSSVPSVRRRRPSSSSTVRPSVRPSVVRRRQAANPRPHANFQKNVEIEVGSMKWKIWWRPKVLTTSLQVPAVWRDRDSWSRSPKLPITQRVFCLEYWFSLGWRLGVYLWSVDFLYAAALRVTSVCILASSELRHEAVARPFRREAVSECACLRKPLRGRFGAKPFRREAVSGRSRFSAPSCVHGPWAARHTFFWWLPTVPVHASRVL